MLFVSYRNGRYSLQYFLFFFLHFMAFWPLLCLTHTLWWNWLNLMQLWQPRVWTRKNSFSIALSPETTLKNEIENKRRGQQARVISSAATHSVLRSLWVWPEAVCWPFSKQSLVWVEMLKLNHTYTDYKNQFICFWQRILYTPFALQFCFVLTCVSDLSPMFLCAQHILYKPFWKCAWKTCATFCKQLWPLVWIHTHACFWRIRTICTLTTALKSSQVI